MGRQLLKCLILAVVIVGGAQFVLAQKTDPQLLAKLIEVTSSSHPFRQAVPDFIKPPAPDPAKVATRFDPVLAESTELTADQKQFIKTNYSKLALLVNDKLIVAASKHVKLSDWLTAYLTETYSKELTDAQMREWLAYFETSEGKLTLKAILAVPQPTDTESQALLQKFEKAPLGIKFIAIFGSDLNAVIQSKLGEVEATVKEEMAKALSPAELKKIFTQFVSENYKKP